MYIFKSKVENHQEIKKKLLQQIDLIPKNPFQKQGQELMHTDWNIPSTMHREYANLFLKTIHPHLIKVSKAVGTDTYEMCNFWFQKYGKGGHHGWHNHAGGHYANVYFVECPKGVSTKFKNIVEECDEGDILSFPAFLPHSSPILETDSVKTVIAFNINLVIHDKEYI
tara:strand:- start:3028 stop:3531 length:504 start_codon:yes stop_codon:yes gene_type:complete